eukprot:256746-Karenia_brevis.AAC.1
MSVRARAGRGHGKGIRRGWDRPWGGFDRFGRQGVLRTISLGPSAAAEPVAAAEPSAAREPSSPVEPSAAAPPRLIECKQEPQRSHPCL